MPVATFYSPPSLYDLIVSADNFSHDILSGKDLISDLEKI